MDNVMEEDTDCDGSVDENDGLKSLKSKVQSLFKGNDDKPNSTDISALAYRKEKSKIQSLFKGNSKKAENDDKPTSTDILSLSYLKEKSTPTFAENVESFALPSCYTMINEAPAKSRGHLVLIVNKTFPKVKDEKGVVIDSTREGAEVDLCNMTTIAKKMGFDISSVSDFPQNMPKDKMEELLEDTRKADHSKCDCFLFMISSHGEMFDTPEGKEHGISTSDGQKILTRKILEKFNDVNCPTLKDKPKIFIIQACRGDGLDEGVDLNKLAERKENEIKSRGNSKDSKDNTDAQGIDNVTDVPDTSRGEDSWQSMFTKAPDEVVRSTHRITCDNDMLVLYAAPPGMFAWRSNTDGSWMIHYLKKVITERGRPDNFLKVLTRVAKRMSERATKTIDKENAETLTKENIENHDKKAVSFLEHNLVRPLII